MRHYVGLDVGKGSHWACVIDEQGEVILSRRVEATEEALEAFCSEIAELGVNNERVLGIDLTGGPAALLEAVMLGRGEQVRYGPGTAVNKAPEAYAGGEQKSDSKDAFVIADQLRLRASLAIALGGSSSGGERCRTAGIGRPPEGLGAGPDPARDPTQGAFGERLSGS
jgi:hypothetical protein